MLVGDGLRVCMDDVQPTEKKMLSQWDAGESDTSRTLSYRYQLRSFRMPYLRKRLLFPC